MLTLLMLIAFGPAAAQDESPPGVPEPAPKAPLLLPATPCGANAAWLLALFEQDGPAVEADRFSEEFYEAVSEDRLEQTVELWRTVTRGLELHEVISDDGQTLELGVRMRRDGSRHVLTVFCEPEPPHRIRRFMLNPDERPAEPLRFDQWSEVDTHLESLPGAAALAIWSIDAEGRMIPVHRLRADEPMALGRGSRLLVLHGMLHEVLAGRTAWKETFQIIEQLKSMPPGPMRAIDDGEPMALAHFAFSMMRFDDDTAMDHLVNAIGRERLEAHLSEFGVDDPRNRPFLTTKELYTLKLAPTRRLLDRYVSADENGRRRLLRSEVIEEEIFEPFFMSWSNPIELDQVGWFASADRLAAMLAEINGYSSLREHADPLEKILADEPDLPVDREAWSHASLIEAGEPGALTVLMLLDRVEGDTHVLSLILNNPEADQNRDVTQPVIGAIVKFLGRRN